MLKTLLALILLGAVPAAHAQPLLFRLADADSTLWLLGSVHALERDDYPLDARIERAYRDAERVVLEISPGELDPATLAHVALPLARQQGDATLADAFSNEEYAKLRQGLARLGLDIGQLRGFEPWFVALQVFSLNVINSGFATAEGVDAHYGQRALRDGKETAGLETAQQQFEMFDALPPHAQKRFLLDAVEDTSGFREEMRRIVDAWRRGDEAALLALMEREFAGEPELQDALLDARNRRWREQVEELLAAPGDTLVIVGALHLVGDNGLVRLLERSGHDVEKVTSSEQVERQRQR